jgi:thiamine pyrophosphate-dependent acetolactate synthase large subunit-like protein
MVDVIKSLKIEHIYSNPASSFRGLHESLINYGKNSMPDFITCMHEESSVAMCHGYYKASGKPQMMLCHGTVGLMHATMAVYNAWADRVPIIMVGGNDLDASKRPPGVPTFHSAQDIGALVRDFTKWDDTPVSAQHFAQSFVRAYRYAMQPPYGPVLLSLDAGLQDSPVDDPHLYIPRYVPTSPPHADVNALRETAKLLVAAENPVVIADRAARTQKGTDLLVQLAELLQIPVVDQNNRVNMPNTHYLNQSAQAQNLIRNADLIVGLELHDIWATVNQFVDNGDEHGHGIRESRIKPGTKLISINCAELNTKSNYQDFQRFQVTDIGMTGDAEASLPFLIEAVKSAIPNDRKAAIEKRGEAAKKAFAEARERTKQAAALAWDASPISTARLVMETFAQIKGLDWSLVASSGNVSNWPNRLWPMEKHYHWLGASGGYGVGYGAPASVGAALANRDLGRFSVSIQSDGDLMYAPGVLWTAAKHKIPLLSVMHNNRGYHQELMHVQRLSSFRNRVASLGGDIGPIGTSIMNPDIEYHKLAESMGWWAKGPIKDPAQLGAAIKEAVAVVKSGQPALVNVWTQPR